MKDLIFISAQPIDAPYFIWQLDVQLNSFREIGISSQCEVLGWDREVHDSGWEKLIEKYPEVKFFNYKDKGCNLSLYIPVIRPHILKQHFLEHKDRLAGKAFFYHDSDILFRELPDFESMLQDDVVYVSDTISYVGANYLVSKAKQGNLPSENFVVDRLGRLANLSSEDIIKRNADSGGAQYLLKNIDYKYWEDVEKFCIASRDLLMNHINKTYFKSENEGYQSWTADMWAVLYNLWNRGIETKVTDKLDFTWATSRIEEYYKKPIFHLAGSTGRPIKTTKDGVETIHHLFYKGAYINKSPIGLDHSYISKEYCSWKYVEAMQKVSN